MKRAGEFAGPFSFSGKFLKTKILVRASRFGHGVSHFGLWLSQLRNRFECDRGARNRADTARRT
jgi:hypothetical protein